MFTQPLNISFDLPDWLTDFSQTYVTSTDLNARMAFVIAAARMNVEQGTGGPFAAAVFEAGTGKLVSLGVNLVTSRNLSMLHAEMVALAVAQRKLGTYDLGAESLAVHELIASTEPCSMCLGAIPWSGIRQVATGARDEDARAIGFDEGTKPGDWIGSLTSRGIKVSPDIERESARTVLQLYVQENGRIYNPQN
jgi:tRNA(Arg) A34 adenosine deaminase TadA